VPGSWAYRVIKGFGQPAFTGNLLSADWQRCIPANVPTADWGAGGDTSRAATLLHTLAHDSEKGAK
jgi:hypothetical protein